MPLPINKTMPQINFSYNWNNKLQCNRYTTLRIWNPEKYRVGEIYDIFLKDKLIQKSELMAQRQLRFNEFNSFIAGIDTGYDLETFKGIVEKMYPGANQKMFGLYLFEVKERYEPGNAAVQPETRFQTDVDPLPDVYTSALIPHESVPVAVFSKTDPESIDTIIRYLCNVYRAEIIAADGNRNLIAKLNHTLLEAAYYLNPALSNDDKTIMSIMGIIRNHCAKIIENFKAKKGQQLAIFNLL